MKIENLAKPIESGSIEEHEKILEDKLIGIELEYIDRLFSKQIPPIDEEFSVDDFTALLSQYTQIPHKLKFSFYDRTKEDGNEKECELFQQKVLNSISDLYEKDHEHWIEKSQQLMKDELEALGPIRQNKEEDVKEYVGLLHFARHDFSGLNVETKFLKQFKDLDINSGDTYLSIHFDDLYKQKGDDTKNLFSSNSLEKLAMKIVGEYPETKAIIGESWLMSTPIAGRIGFITSYDVPDKRLAGTFWGQFIGSNGQINTDRVSQFLETGKPPYKPAIGVMKTEDFLRKYLPMERRGKIILKEVKPGFEEQLEREKESIRVIFNDWDKITEKDIDRIVSSCEIYFDFSKTEQGKGIIDFIKELKKNNESIKNIKDKDFFKKYDELFKEYIKKLKFIDKEVII